MELALGNTLLNVRQSSIFLYVDHSLLLQAYEVAKRRHEEAEEAFRSIDNKMEFIDFVNIRLKLVMETADSVAKVRHGVFRPTMILIQVEDH